MASPFIVGIGDSIMSSAPGPSDSVADISPEYYPIPGTYSPLYFWADDYPTPFIYRGMG
jgi:hypothetical protein